MPDIKRIIDASHAELAFDFVRSSGPGGQNVNKVATSAQLHFDAATSNALPEQAKVRLRELAGRRMTAEGILIIEARRYRTQEQNRVDAITRFDELLRRALEESKPRRPTRATAASREKRLVSKKKKGEIKKARQSSTYNY
jgi:ribosome-associated protein